MNHVTVRYGASIARGLPEMLGEYVVIATAPAWALGEPFFESRPPAAVFMADTLDEDKLDAMYGRMTAGALRPGVQIVGVGGGTVLDAAKYFAYRHGVVPVLVPSITSTNAPFSDYISIRRGGGPFGFKVDGYPKQVVVDTDLIALADPRLNRAGYGDLLYMQTALRDWEILSSRGAGAPMNAAVREEIAGLMREAMRDASEIGAMTEAGIRLLMTYTQRSAALSMANPALPISAGAEHLFAWNLDLICERPLIHGEVVSLGIAIASYLQSAYVQDDSARALRHALEEGRVRYRPEVIGVSWTQVEEALLTVEAYNERVRGYRTVFGLTSWTPELLAQVRRYICDT